MSAPVRRSAPGGAARAAELGLFVAAFIVSSLVILALLWSGPAPYRDLARAHQPERVVFVLPPPLERREFDRESVVFLHEEWSRYVTGGSSEPPRFGSPLFSDDEYRHMADVRRVFDAAKLAVPLSLVVLVVRLRRSRARSPREMWALVRRGALTAAGLVALVGAVAAVAFEPLFLLFHRVFFPQGNYLFDPATSNLVRLYPDWYWEGLTLRIGATFLALALALAAFAAARLRAAR